MGANDVLLQIYISVDLPASYISVGGQVEYRRNAFHGLCKSRAVKNVALNQSYSSLTNGRFEVLPEAGAKIVIDDDLIIATDQFIDDMTADEARTSSHKCFHRLLFRFSRKKSIINRAPPDLANLHTASTARYRLL